MKPILTTLLFLISFKSIAQISITIQPSTSTQTLCLGATANTLSVTATGTGVLSYQWYSNTINSNIGGTIINAATSSSYTPSTTTAGTLYYYVVITVANSVSVTSNVSGAITVNALPSSSFTVTPSVLCSGFPVQFNAPSACASNGALNFSGSSSSALRTTITTQVDNITMEVWAKWSGGKNAQLDDQEIFYNGHTGNGGYGILMTANGNLKILIGGLAYLGSSQNLTAGVWTHIAIVRNAGTWSLYVNGAQNTVSPNTTTPSSPTTASGNSTCIGADQSGTGHLFYGSIDEVKFWTIARSTADIQADMTACSVSPQSGLLAYWNFNEGSGNTANDGSGNAYSLNLTNTNWLAAGSPTGATYVWDFGGGATSTLGSDAYTYASSGTKNISLIVTDLTTSCSSSTTNQISINLSPTASISGTATACNTVSLTASGGISYSWNGGNSATAATNTFSSSNTYTVTVTDAVGCTATVSQSVTVNPLPTAPISGPIASATTFTTSSVTTPYGIAQDATGYLYVATYTGNSINKINASGTVTSFVSSGLNRPAALAFDNSGNLYVANYSGNSISKVNTIGSVTSFVTSGLSGPIALAFDGSGNLYVANYIGNSISKINTSGSVTSFVSSGLNRPSALAFDNSGNLYVANYSGNSISKVNTSGSVTSFVSSGLSSPSGLVFDGSGNLYVSNYGNNTISKVGIDGTVTSFLSTSVNRPRGILYDAAANLFYVTNSSGYSVSKITPPSNYVTSVCNSGAVTLIASPKTGETVDWYAASSGGTALQTGSNSFTTPTISTTTIYYAEARNTTTGCTSATRTPLTATVNNCAITWIGGTSSDFSNPANWSGGVVPTVVNDFVVASSANNPIITGTHAVNNFTINTGASLTVTGTIKIAGSITNNGTFTATSGTVELNGNTAQTIPANAFASNTVGNLTINNASGVTLGGALNLTGVLTPTAGTLFTGGNLTLISTDINGGGAIGQGSGSYISGTVNVQRYTQAQRGYRTLAHPYTTGQPLSLLTNTIRITGLDTANGTYGTTLAGGNPSVFYYNPLKPAGSASVLEPITSPTSTAKWQPANAIFLFVRGNGNEGAGGPGISNYGGSVISPVTLTATNGLINQGDVTVPLLYGDVTTDNYNLLGNPYPCPINLKNVLGLPFGTIYVYNPTKNIAVGSPYSIAGGFDTYTHNGSNDIVVPNMGAFYVKATSTGQSITFKETDKTIALTPSYATFGVNKNPLVHLVIKNSKGIVDDLKIGYNNTSTSEATDTYDATKKANSLLDFYTLSSDNQRLAVDYRNENFNDTTIALGIKTLLTGTYTISAATIADLPNVKFMLHDKLLNKEILLVANTDGYNFNITSDTATKGNNRFEIRVLGTGVLPTSISSFTAMLTINNKVTVNWQSVTEVNADYYHLQRSIDGITFSDIAKIAATGNGSYMYSDDLSKLFSLPKTIYYRLQMVDKDGSKAYTKTVTVIPINNTNNGLSIYPNPIKSALYAEVNTAAPCKASLSITDANGKLVLQQVETINAGRTTIALPASQLAAGAYSLIVITNEAKYQQQFIKY